MCDIRIHVYSKKWEFPKFSASTSSALFTNCSCGRILGYHGDRSPTCLVMRSLLSMTTQLFPPSFTFGTLLITLHILHNAWFKGALEQNILPKLLNNTVALISGSENYHWCLNAFWAIQLHAHRLVASLVDELWERCIWRNSLKRNIW